MEGIIVHYRRGNRTQQKYQMLVRVNSINSKDKAKSIIGKKVLWKSTAGKEIKGEVTNTHGNSGVLRVQFEKGLPGQSIATKVKIE